MPTLTLPPRLFALLAHALLVLGVWSFPAVPEGAAHTLVEQVSQLVAEAEGPVVPWLVASHADDEDANGALVKELEGSEGPTEDGDAGDPVDADPADAAPIRLTLTLARVAEADHATPIPVTDDRIGRATLEHRRPGARAPPVVRPVV